VLAVAVHRLSPRSAGEHRMLQPDVVPSLFVKIG
jgi:hypothetical protein